jgi:hypothetical protein
MLHREYKVTNGVYETSLPIDEIVYNSPEIVEHVGVPSEDIVENVCPDLQRLQSLINKFEQNNDWAELVLIGDMYAKGSFPVYSPDENTALRIYSIVSKCPDALISSSAMSKYIDTRMNPLSLEDRMGIPFPKDISLSLIKSAEDRIKRVPLSEFMGSSSRIIKSNTENRRLINRTHQERTIRHTNPVVLGTPILGPNHPIALELDQIVPRDIPVNIDQVPRQQFQLDVQNVHDHAVNASVTNNIRSLIAENGNTATYDRVELIEEVMGKVKEARLSKQNEKKAYRVLVTLVPDMISSIGCSQIDVLYAVFNKIKSIDDKNVRKNLFESLAKNLSSGVERGHVVCSSGRIGRLITTLDGIDQVHLGSTAIQKAVSMDTVRNEIGILASKIREDVIRESSNEERDNYELSDTSRLTTVMKDRFNREVKKTYIDGLKLQSEIIAPISELYGSAF